MFFVSFLFTTHTFLLGYSKIARRLRLEGKIFMWKLWVMRSEKSSLICRNDAWLVFCSLNSSLVEANRQTQAPYKLKTIWETNKRSPCRNNWIWLSALFLLFINAMYALYLFLVGRVPLELWLVTKILSKIAIILVIRLIYDSKENEYYFHFSNTINIWSESKSVCSQTVFQFLVICFFL